MDGYKETGGRGAGNSPSLRPSALAYARLARCGTHSARESASRHRPLNDKTNPAAQEHAFERKPRKARLKPSHRAAGLADAPADAPPAPSSHGPPPRLHHRARPRSSLEATDRAAASLRTTTRTVRRCRAKRAQALETAPGARSNGGRRSTAAAAPGGGRAGGGIVERVGPRAPRSPETDSPASARSRGASAAPQKWTRRRTRGRRRTLSSRTRTRPTARRPTRRCGSPRGRRRNGANGRRSTSGGARPRSCSGRPPRRRFADAEATAARRPAKPSAPRKPAAGGAGSGRQGARRPEGGTGAAPRPAAGRPRRFSSVAADAPAPASFAAVAAAPAPALESKSS